MKQAILAIVLPIALFSQEDYNIKEGSFDYGEEPQLKEYQGEFIKDGSGLFKEKLPHGKGKLYRPEMDQEKLVKKGYDTTFYEYDGSWKEGSKNGEGVEKTNAFVYKGEYKEGRFNGKGEINYIEVKEYNGNVTTPKGNKLIVKKYNGEWKSGEISGFGKIYLCEEVLNTECKGEYVYTGELINGVPNGEGVMRYPNGDELTGVWKDFEFTGKGKRIYANDRLYTFEGEWEQGLWNKGRLSWRDQHDKENYFKGTWIDKEFTGEFNIYYYEKLLDEDFSSQLALVKGTIKNKKVSGKTKVVFEDGSGTGENKTKEHVYEGDIKATISSFDFKDELHINEGTFIEVKEVVIEGRGTLKYADEPNIRGLYKKGVFKGFKCTGESKIKYDFEVPPIHKHSDEYSLFTGVYTGAIKENQPTDTNAVFTSTGSIQVGQWLYFEKAFLNFKGGFKKGQPDGKGELILQSDTLASNYNEESLKIYYSGEWEQNTLTGEGVLKYNLVYNNTPQGYTYEGGFNNNFFANAGNYEYKQKSSFEKYKGNFWQGYYDSEGVLETEYYTYKGSFNEGKFYDDNGKITYKNGGSIKHWDTDNIVMYVGAWRYSVPEGKGKRKFKNGKVEDGYFSKGNFIEPYKPKTAKVGNQVWSAENLSVTTFRNGDPIPEAKTVKEWENAARSGSPAFCHIVNDPKHSAEHGVLYNWPAITDSRGIAPLGWRIPSHIDAKELINYLEKDRNEIKNAIKNKESQGISARDLKGKLSKLDYGGYKLKAKSGWESSSKFSKNGSDLYGFNAKPVWYRHSGYRDNVSGEGQNSYTYYTIEESSRYGRTPNGEFQLSESAKFWTSSYRGDYAGTTLIIDKSNEVFLSSTHKSWGMPVRLIKE